PTVRSLEHATQSRTLELVAAGAAVATGPLLIEVTAATPEILPGAAADRRAGSGVHRHRLHGYHHQSQGQAQQRQPYESRPSQRFHPVLLFSSPRLSEKNPRARRERFLDSALSAPINHGAAEPVRRAG